jgi:hypothetical protein
MEVGLPRFSPAFRQLLCTCYTQSSVMHLVSVSKMSRSLSSEVAFYTFHLQVSTSGFAQGSTPCYSNRPLQCPLGVCFLSTVNLHLTPEPLSPAVVLVSHPSSSPESAVVCEMVPHVLSSPQIWHIRNRIINIQCKPAPTINFVTFVKYITDHSIIQSFYRNTHCRWNYLFNWERHPEADSMCPHQAWWCFQ